MKGLKPLAAPERHHYLSVDCKLKQKENPFQVVDIHGGQIAAWGRQLLRLQGQTMGTAETHVS